jgi:quinohemoprotein ethanol dehydrogenase
VFLLLLASDAISEIVVNEDAIDNPGKNWLNYGRDYSEQRFSPLDKINDDNIQELNLSWSYRFPTARGLEATPLVHEGVIYVTTAWSNVYALDAKNGNALWTFDAQVSKAHLAKTCCGPVNRGVALWQGTKDDQLQVFVGALDGRLIAIDAKTGKVNWSVQTTPIDSNYSVTGAPRVLKGMVIIGNGGAELGVRGYISAYDALTGNLKWRFHTVPGDPSEPQENDALETALATWQGDYWHQQGGGGGTVWDTLVYDSEHDLLFIGTGNGSPWNRDVRSPGGGDNLFLSSIVALKPDSGQYVWHYQVTPRDNWDYTATQQLVLADIELDDQIRSVVMQAPKNGFFYVLDRLTGELLSADPFTKTTWATHVDMSSGRPVETEEANYQKNGPSYLWPGPYGAHNWQPMSYSPKTKLMYIPVQNMPFYFSADKKPVTHRINRWNTGIDLNEARHPESWVAAKASVDALAYGELVAWDPIKKSRAWDIRHAKPSNGGILSTAGNLVFQGTQEGRFIAYDATNGELLWSFQSDSAILAGPVAYEIDGEQYIAVGQGGGGVAMLTIGNELKYDRVNRNRLLVFKLGEATERHKKMSEELAKIEPVLIKSETDPAIIERGQVLYSSNCGSCHGISAKSGGIVPDLRYMSQQTHEEFVNIVLGGSKVHQGMIGFAETLDLTDAQSLHAYLAAQQKELPNKLDMSVIQKIEYWVMYLSAKLGERFPFLLNASREMVY